MMKRLPIKLTAHWHGLRSDSYSRQWRTVGVSVQGIRWAVTPWAARCPLISRRRYASWERPDFCKKYRQCVHPFKILRRCIVRRKRQRPITDGSRSEGKSFPTGRLFFFANRAGVLGAWPLTRESCWQDSMLATTAQGAVPIPAGAGAYPTRPYLPWPLSGCFGSRARMPPRPFCSMSWAL